MCGLQKTMGIIYRNFMSNITKQTMKSIMIALFAFFRCIQAEMLLVVTLSCNGHAVTL